MFTRQEVILSSSLLAVVLFVLPFFGPPIMLLGSAFAMVGWTLVFRRFLRGSVLIPVCLTGCLTLLAVVSLFGS